MTSITISLLPILLPASTEIGPHLHAALTTASCDRFSKLTEIYLNEKSTTSLDINKYARVMYELI
jgi:hypothetical protein